jgi:adenylate cyclase
VIELLNAYLTDMSDVIDRNGGVVDKFVGDEIMALFGAPISHDDDADRALRTALEMRRALEKLNHKLTARIFPTIEIGIGINTADVVAGKVGSNTRLDYTVIGDGVNLASRLETLTKTPEYNARIIISEATLRAARGQYKTRFLDEVAVKGKTLPTRIHALDDASQSK